MVTQTATKPIITQAELERYLPNPIRRSGNEYRTWTEDSRSKTHIAINLDKGVYYDFHYNQGGSLVSLLRQLGAPIGQEKARASPSLTYKRQLAILAKTKSLGRTYRCGTHTALRTDVISGEHDAAHRVMCLRWNCPKCAPFLKRVHMEHLADYHFGAIYLIPKGYEPGTALNRIKQKARRAGGEFEWLLLESNELKILFVESSSLPKVTEWLRDEPFFELEAFNPTYAERTKWLERGLEQMTEASHWSHKVRHSRGIASIKCDVDNVKDTRSEIITLSTQEYWDLEMIKMRLVEVVMQGKRQVQLDKGLGFKRVRAWLVGGWGTQLEPYGVLELRMYEDGGAVLLCDATVDKSTFPSRHWNVITKTLEELVAELESRGYTVDWLTVDIVNLIPPEGGGWHDNW